MNQSVIISNQDTLFESKNQQFRYYEKFNQLENLSYYCTVKHYTKNGCVCQYIKKD